MRCEEQQNNLVVGGLAFVGRGGRHTKGLYMYERRIITCGSGSDAIGTPKERPPLEGVCRAVL